MAFTTYIVERNPLRILLVESIQTTFSVYKMMENPTVDLFGKALRICRYEMNVTEAAAEIKRNVKMNTFEMTPLQGNISKQASDPACHKS